MLSPSHILLLVREILIHTRVVILSHSRVVILLSHTRVILSWHHAGMVHLGHILLREIVLVHWRHILLREIILVHHGWGLKTSPHIVTHTSHVTSHTSHLRVLLTHILLRITLIHTHWVHTSSHIHSTHIISHRHTSHRHISHLIHSHALVRVTSNLTRTSETRDLSGDGLITLLIELLIFVRFVLFLSLDTIVSVELVPKS